MITIKVQGMSCGGCVAAIRKAIAAVAPGAAVEVDLATREVRVEGLEERAARAAIRAAGYETV